MHTTSYNFTDFNSRITHKPIIAGLSGVIIPPRRPAVLSRRELQRLILDMVD